MTSEPEKPRMVSTGGLQPGKVEVQRRQHRRVKLVAEIQCQSADRDETMVVRQVSEGGMFINVQFPLPVDSEMWLTFQLHPADPAISCRARVRYSRLGWGMGIQFLDLGPEGRERIRQYVGDSE
ncbi:MAG TPA: PilZ domain-containing protein [Terriglobia bacterium]|nr:PilZ domain-containing protein [Terriglobia bacterium]